jgi:choline dehydrogenase-like flavoprotein
MVYEVPLDKRGLAAGVHYIDKSTNARHFASARAVVLAASTCETARILLNSKSAQFPHGLANSSGQVGRNLTDSVVTGVSGDIPILQGLPPFNDDGASASHIDVPWWGHKLSAAGRLSFTSEYRVQVGGDRGMMPSVDSFAGLQRRFGALLYGKALRDRLRSAFGSQVTLLSVGGMIPNPDCRCDIDPQVKDRWGIPVLRFHWKPGRQEIEQARHGIASMHDMISAMGGTPMVDTQPDGGIMWGGGNSFHELGTARMGTKPADSVLNSSGQSWDVGNLYIADGASFAGHAAKNPTETIMALAWRASDHLADSFLRKEI